VARFNPGNVEFGLRDLDLVLGWGHLPWIEGISKTFEDFLSWYEGASSPKASPVYTNKTSESNSNGV
jgi:hypothetical protein